MKIKIKITAHIPVQDDIRPKIGEIYDVINPTKKLIRSRHDSDIFFVKIKDTEVGVFVHECVVVETES